MYGELEPLGDGDPIYLTKKKLLVGRKGHCDIVLPEKQVSSEHCELYLEDDYWNVRDLKSTNGTRVNGVKVTGEERLVPGDIIAFAKYSYEIKYTVGGDSTR